MAARPSRHPAAHSGIACAHAGKQRVSEGGPGHVCTRQTRGGTRPGTRTAHEVPAECASVGAAGARVSARCPPWAASPWRSAARHSRGGRSHGRSAGNGSWPAEMARRHLFPPPGLRHSWVNCSRIAQNCSSSQSPIAPLLHIALIAPPIAQIAQDCSGLLRGAMGKAMRSNEEQCAKQ